MSKRSPNAPQRSSKKVADDDAFVAGVLEASNWAQRNQQLLVTGGIVIAVVAAIAWYLTSSSANRRDAALVELESVTAAAATLDPEQAKVQLAQYLERFGATPYADEARLVLATLYLETDLPAQALDVLAGANAGPRDPMGPQFLSLEGKAHEAAGSLESAVAAYDRLAGAAQHDFQRRAALGDAARVRGLLGQYAQAADIWADLADELESSDPQKGIYLMRAAEMRALAG
jgi:tetratricopeptide (TPR) repeat protein